MLVVSGANGFLGSHFMIECIRRKKRITGLVRPNADRSYFNSLVQHYQINSEDLNLVNWCEIDYNDPFEVREKLADHKVFVHCAGLICFDNSYKDDLIEANRDLTESLVNACIDLKFEKFIYLSSIATCSYMSNMQGKLEDKFDSAYGLSKFLGELEVLRGEEEGLEGIIVRPGVVLGPPPPNNEFHQLFSWIKKGWTYAPVGSTGFVEIIDLANYVADLADGKEVVDNTAVSSSFKFAELNAAIAKHLGISKKVKPLSSALLKAGSFITKIVYGFSKEPQPLPKPAVDALISDSQYDSPEFATHYGSKQSPELITENMVSYLKSFGKS
ncbi:NAD-dependent epimerase/dehydratase family protein [Luteibaculum oceani]|uniref:NAD(P)-dependent oxidoreductase n=1 Tax=Luteibaculum oceani TaxID=1294296 RepID=A0A5C6V1M6_9FLAO|nr:NAD(P)-dependent oxidoreductase [Luteibaculum oceani]TXC78894.1 NAD(P)-dependent oxidoreductase [Luteibaculum oceani]